MKNFEHLRVLFADNDEDTCLLVTTILGFANIEVITARTVDEACWLGQTEYFDLYLLDSRLPDGSGLEICRCLRAYAPLKPILFYSAYAYETDVQKGLLAGANDYLIKPYFGDLSKTVRQAVNLSQQFAAESFNNSFIKLQKNSGEKNNYETV